MRRVLLTLMIAGLFATSATASMRDGIDAFKQKRWQIALRELTPAAIDGVPQARYLLGLMLVRGLGVPARVPFGLSLLKSAAQDGHSMADDAVRTIERNHPNLQSLTGERLAQALEVLSRRVGAPKVARQGPPPPFGNRPPPPHPPIALQQPPEQQPPGQQPPGILSPSGADIPKDLVLAVQKRLEQLGFDPGPLDGIRGEKTRIAIRAFERMEGIPPTGLPSPIVLAKLNDAVVQTPPGNLQSVTPPAPTPVQDNPGAPGDDIVFGTYRALVIGNNSYDHLPSLKTARNDARSVADVLERDYAFKVTRLFDANRYDLVTALNRLREQATGDDNVLIYYAGHGILDKAADEGYWLPVDAEAANPANWVSNATIIASLKAMPARHVMVIADSCFSGKLTRGIQASPRSADHLERVAVKRARTALTSGGLEPVADGGQDGHSVFAAALIGALRDNTGILDGTSLFHEIRRPVILNSDQTPEYADIRKAGHDGGDFLFRKPKS